jgi:hypothetical protein
MDKTAIHAGAPPATAGHSMAIQAEAPLVRPEPSPQTARAPKSVLYRALLIVADLRITVTLFALSLFLVFYGTLAQVDKGIWTVVADYFRSPMVWIPLHVVLLRLVEESRYSIPYPGGWLLGGLLLANLVAAHAVSFKVSWKRSGILAIHSGIVVMMLGELITGLFAVEGHMTINQNESCNFVEHSGSPELAVVRTVDAKKDEVTVIPTARLKRGGVIQDAALPFDVEIVKYMVNSRHVDAEPGDENLATRGQGLRFTVVERPEGTGVDKEQKIDIASAYVKLKDRRTGADLGTYLFTAFLAQPEWIEVDGKQYQVSLRFKRSYKDYTFRLDKLNVSYYPNTDKPKDYSSFIHLTDPTQKEDRDVRIFMNHPFTYAGETFYQSGVQEGAGRPRATILQVVHNPGWMLPYLSCFLVATGMLVHFGQNLYRFVERRIG